jgi:hypothetical protein
MIFVKENFNKLNNLALMCFFEFWEIIYALKFVIRGIIHFLYIKINSGSRMRYNILCWHYCTTFNLMRVLENEYLG